MNVEKEKDKYFVNVIFFLLYGKLQSFFSSFFLINKLSGCIFSKGLVSRYGVSY